MGFLLIIDKSVASQVIISVEAAGKGKGRVEADVVLPGIDRPVRPINADFPLNQSVVDSMNSCRILDDWIDSERS
jgi:hypothetical protein